MMAFSFREFTHLVRKGQGLDEIWKGKAPFQVVNAFYCDHTPIGDLGTKFGNLFFCHGRLTFSTSDTLHMMKLRHALFLFLAMMRINDKHYPYYSPLST